MNKEQNVFIDRFNEIVGADATQEEIAQKIGTSRQNVGNWLSGKSKPDINMLAKIATAYEVSTDYLLGISDVKTSDAEKKAACEYTHLTDEAIDGLSFIADFDPRVLPTVIYLLEQHYEFYGSKSFFKQYDGQESILATLSAYLRVEPKMEVKTTDNTLYISETGKLLTVQVKAGENREFQDGWRVQSVDSCEIIDKILFDSLEKAVRLSKRRYNQKTMLYKTDFQLTKNSISAESGNIEDEYPF